MTRSRRRTPFSFKRMLNDSNGLLTRLELAFALEPVHRIRPLGRMGGQRKVVSPPPSGDEPETE